MLRPHQNSRAERGSKLDDPAMDRGAIADRERKLWFPFDSPAGGLPIVRTDPLTIYYFHDQPSSDRYIEATIWGSGTGNGIGIVDSHPITTSRR
ncbi:MAG: hypothetical protein O2960_29280 [Verrucomicrobia bacterium]|nr:hypothetical protein [Verrucomicrobiota bacterium]